MSKKRNKKTRVQPVRAKGVDLAQLPERLADGITQGPTALEEADERFPKMPGAVDLSYLNKSGGIKFRALNAQENFGVLRFPDGRMFRDVDVAFTPEDRKKIEQGYICLRCYEPQSGANADDHLEGCVGVDQYGERYMRDGHMMIDVAAEFDDRMIHVGPRRPLQQYVDEQDERNNKLLWIKEQVDKGNGDEALREFRRMVEDAQTNAPR